LAEVDVALVGGTGFIGQALARRLVQDGQRVAIVSRRSDARIPDGCSLVADGSVPVARAVVNLAGSPIATRWTKKNWAQIESSRLALTRTLVESFAFDPPEVFVCASAVGFYGDRGDTPLTEEEPSGSDRAAVLCASWEAIAEQAEELGVRVARPRIGVVLGDGGALAAMRRPFKACLGGPLGSGRQWLPWIHLDDATRALALAMERLSGPLNVVAPHPVRQKDFATTLGRTLGRPAVLPAPEFALKLALGEAAGLLLASQRALPTALLDEDFTFEHPHLEGALSALLG
jgi:uncharacterized protein